MTVVLSIEIIGGDAFRKVLNEAPQIVRPALSRAINESAFFLEGEAKGNAPVNEGRLRGSIQTRPARPEENMRAVVGTNVNYAVFQEFGTGVFAGGSPIRPKNAKVLRFKTKGGAIVYARQVRGTRATHFMGKAKNATVPILNQNLGKALDIIVKELATGK